MEQCGCIVEQCGNVDFHISNVNKCIYIADQNNGDLRSFIDKYELYRTEQNRTEILF